MGQPKLSQKKRFFVLKLVVKPHGEAGVPIFCKRFLGQDFLEGILRGNRPADGIFAKW